MEKILAERLKAANVPAMVVTMGGDGAVYAEADGESGFCPAQKVQVKDTTGAGDAFCAGVSAGLTYGKTLGKAVEIGTRLAASVITSSENVCPALPPGRVRHRGIEGGRNEVTVRNRQPGQNSTRCVTALPVLGLS